MRRATGVDKEKYGKAKAPRLLNEEGGVGRREIILLGLLGLVGGGGGFLYYKLKSVTGAMEAFSAAGTVEKLKVLDSALKGKPLPAKLTQRIKKEKAVGQRRDAFDRKLEELRKITKFMFAESKLSRAAFNPEKTPEKFFNAIQVYLRIIFQSYKLKKDIPFETLAEVLNEFPEKKIFILLCCCCGRPGNREIDYMTLALLKNGYAALDGKSKDEADYLIRVVHSIIYLRADWYNNLIDQANSSPKTSAALQVVWNFLNAYDLPLDLIKNKNYYVESIV